jgi:hypothetical protein
MNRVAFIEHRDPGYLTDPQLELIMALSALLRKIHQYLPMRIEGEEVLRRTLQLP